MAQRKDFHTQKLRLWKILPVSITGGIAGGLLLLNTSENSFRILIPFLILLAAIILALQPRLKKYLEARLAKSLHHKTNDFLILLVIFPAAIYGGYFGAGLGVILVIGGLLGFLPILGFWMLPLGLIVLSIDFALVRRWRR